MSDAKLWGLRNRAERAANALAARDQWRRGPGYAAAIRVMAAWWAWTGKPWVEGDEYRRAHGLYGM